MKSILYLASIILLSTTQSSFAQDILTKSNNEVISSKIIEINQNEIKYKSFNNLNGPLIIIPKEDVKSIKYENGVMEIFSSNYENTSSQKNGNEPDFYDLGTQDATKYYKGYSGAGTGTLLTGLLVSPLIGLVPALATAGTPPSERSLNYPNSSLMRNPEYARGYSQTSFTIKKNKVWTNWMVSFGMSVVAYTILYRQLHK